MYTVIEQISINEWWELGCPLLTRGFKRKQKEKPRVIHVLLDCACMNAKSLQSCLTLCDPMDCSPSGSSVHGILQARILEWVAISYSRGSSWPRDWTQVSCGSCTAGGFFTTEPLGSMCMSPPHQIHLTIFIYHTVQQIMIYFLKET